MKKILGMLLFLIVYNWAAVAQQHMLSGIVLDKITNKPIENATIQVKGTQKFAVSDAAGKFSLDADAGAILIISHINYNELSIPAVSGENTIWLTPKTIDLENITLKSDVMRDLSVSTVIIDSVKVITQPRNVSDLFRDISGFGIQKRGAYASEPFFRDFKYDELNIQYDGGMKIINACPNRMDPITTHVIPEEIEKIEIVKGPFTVRFGPNFGGIINLVSKNTLTKEGLSGAVETGYETNGSNYFTRAKVGFKTSVFDFIADGSYRNYGDYKDGNGTVVPSSFKTTDYSLRAGYEPAGNQRLQLIWRQSFARDIDHAGLPMDSPYDDSYLGGLDYKITDISSVVSSFMVKGFYAHVDHLMTNDYRPSFAATAASSHVFSTIYGGKTELVLKPSDDFFLFTGLDANFIGREGNRDRLVKVMNGMVLNPPRAFIDKVWQDTKLNDVGVFAEAKYKFADLFVFTAGLRSDFVSSSIADPEQDFLTLYGGTIDPSPETNISGTVSLTYQKNGLQMQLALGRGMRTASITERYINHFSVGLDPYEYVGNPYLSPEINNQVELSVKKDFNRIQLGANIFYSLFEDYIVPVVDESLPRKFMPTVPPVYAKRFINIDEAYQAGFEWFFKYELTDKFRFMTDLSYTYAQNKQLSEPLPQVMPMTAHAGLEFKEQKYWFNLNGRFVAAQRRVSASFMEPETPGFATFDFSAGFEPVKNLTVGASVLNIFEVAYYEHLNFSYTNSDTLSGRIFEPG
ncbi:MAG: TonB-dependent receptor, partial [Flavobacteriaceae bacterium]|nr:TonB-dependent receptor [Flavobacteriaceae bacterium]